MNVRIAHATKLISKTEQRIFRLIHVDNIPWVLRHGLQCFNSEIRSEHYVSIGDHDLITKRCTRIIRDDPPISLADCVPFYFTPWTPMQYAIAKNRQDLAHYPPEDLAFIVTSIPRLQDAHRRFFVSDRHAFMKYAEFTEDSLPEQELPWQQWQSIHFDRSTIDPSDYERYQAEVLVYQELPMHETLGVALYNDYTRMKVVRWCQDAQCDLAVHTRPLWFFE